MLSSRKLALRYSAPPDTAPSRWPTSERATSAENSTGYCPVGTLRGSSRATARSAARRPIAAGDSRSHWARPMLYQPSRCMPSPWPAIRARPSECWVSRSRPMNPWLLAYTDRLCPLPSEAPSEFDTRPSAWRPAASQARARSTAWSACNRHGCQVSRSGKLPSAAGRAISPASARPAAGSSSVWRAIAQACSTVASRLESCRSAVLALPLRWPKYTVTAMPRSRVDSTVSTSPMRTDTFSPRSSLQLTSAWLAPRALARASSRCEISASRSSRSPLSSSPAISFTAHTPDIHDSTDESHWLRSAAAAVQACHPLRCG